MKKIITVFLTLALILGSLSFVLAEDSAEIPGTADMPYAGLTFVPPQAFADAKGIIITEGALDLAENVCYAYWMYFAMTEDELSALYSGETDASTAPFIDLFYVFSIGGGMDFNAMNSIIGNALNPEYAREIGKAGDYTFYLYMEDPNQEFADSIDAEYRDDYLAIAAMKDETAAGFTCYEPLEKPDPYASLVGTKVEFTTTDLDGNPVSSADLFAQNEITMVNIWATWCGPCVGELAELQEINERLKDKDCAVIGLLADDDLDTAKQLIAENGVTYPVVLTPDNIYDLFYFEYIPTSYFIGRDSTILAVPIVGADVTAYEITIDALLDK